MDINNISGRESALSLRKNKCNTTISAKSLITESMNPNIDIDYLLNQYLNETKNSSQADQFVTSYNMLLNHFYSHNRDHYKTVQEAFKELVMASENQKEILKLMENSRLDKQFVENIKSICEANIIYDRVIQNDRKFRNRFTLKEIDQEIYSENTDVESVIESVCNLISSYDMPLYKKLNITLEEVLYNFHKANKSIDKKYLIETTLSCFLANESYLTDKDIKNITHVFESCPFIEKEDLDSISFFTENDTVYTVDKLSIIADNTPVESYKRCITEIMNCNSLTSANITIKRTINTIFNVYVDNNISSLNEAIKIYNSLFTLSLILGSKPTTIVKEIVKETNQMASIINPKDDDEAVLRKEELIKAMNQSCNRFDNKEYGEEIYIEAGLLISELLEDIKVEPKHKIKNLSESYIADLSIYFEDTNFSSFNEAEIVDSNDVKKAIDGYKASQSKNSNTLTRTIKNLYVKKPKDIIDDTPHILGFIRQFGIMSTATIPAVGPICALVLFIADYTISQNINRKEADSVLKYFRNEEKIVNKKIDRLSDKNPNKKRLKAYSEELHKAVLNLEEYRDNLYSEKEQDRIHDEEMMEEQCLMESDYTGLTLAEYFNNVHHIVIQQIKDYISEIYRSLNNNHKFLVEETVDEFGNGCLEDFITSTPSGSIRKYIKPNIGSIVVPILLVSYKELEDLDELVDIVDGVEKRKMFNKSWLSVKPILDCTNTNTAIIEYNYAANIITTNLNDLNESFIYTDKMMAYNILNISESLNVVEENKNILSELIEYIPDMKENEHLDELAKLIALSGLDSREFNFHMNEAVKETLDVMNYCNLMSYIRTSEEIGKIQHENLELQAACVEALQVVKEELSVKNLSKKGIKDTLEKKDKEEKKQKVESEKDHKKIKEKMGNIANRTKDGKIAITTNLGLAIEALKRDAKNIAGKEKEFCTSLDASLSYFKRNIEKALTTNRREAIIKGSIIPSFSKTIKTALVAGISFKINPILGAIGCIGALACSKALTERERKLLLDEIDIELQVVNREIERLGSDAPPQKYRQLVTYKKQLMRESQRIRYRIKVYSKHNPPPMGEV